TKNIGSALAQSGNMCKTGRSLKVPLIAGFLLLGGTFLHAQVLFDATKAEMAGNADWVVDADKHDLGVSTGDGSGQRGAGAESEPQRIPTPAITGITANTAE